jgi:hypothetical protein
MTPDSILQVFDIIISLAGVYIAVAWIIRHRKLWYLAFPAFAGLLHSFVFYSVYTYYNLIAGYGQIVPLLSLHEWGTVVHAHMVITIFFSLIIGKSNLMVMAHDRS